MCRLFSLFFYTAHSFRCAHLCGVFFSKGISNVSHCRCFHDKVQLFFRTVRKRKLLQFCTSAILIKRVPSCVSIVFTRFKWAICFLAPGQRVREELEIIQQIKHCTKIKTDKGERQANNFSPPICLLEKTYSWKDSVLCQQRAASILLLTYLSWHVVCMGLTLHPTMGEAPLAMVTGLGQVCHLRVPHGTSARALGKMPFFV